MTDSQARSHQWQEQPFVAHQETLRGQLRLLLEHLPLPLHADVVLALQSEGKLLFMSPDKVSENRSSRPSGAWSLLTLLIAQHLSPNIDLLYVSRVAIAIECFVCALDLLDDVEDEDQTPIVWSLGAARVLNVSTALLSLTHRSLLSLAELKVSASAILRLLNAVQEEELIAIAGQHRDLLSEQRATLDMTQEECIEIAAWKAGALMRLVCRCGALCADANDIKCEQFSELGRLLGIAHQLDNDCHDLSRLLQASHAGAGTSIPGSEPVKSDLVRRKKTLPIVLAARKQVMLQKTALSADEEKQAEMQALHYGVLAAWSLCLLYRERARLLLQELTTQRVVSTELRRLLGLEEGGKEDIA